MSKDSRRVCEFSLNFEPASFIFVLLKKLPKGLSFWQFLTYIFLLTKKT